jgi:hypothetical protein
MRHARARAQMRLPRSRPHIHHGCRPHLAGRRAKAAGKRAGLALGARARAGGAGHPGQAGGARDGAGRRDGAGGAGTAGHVGPGGLVPDGVQGRRDVQGGVGRLAQGLREGEGGGELVQGLETCSEGRSTRGLPALAGAGRHRRRARGRSGPWAAPPRLARQPGGGRGGGGGTAAHREFGQVEGRQALQAPRRQADAELGGGGSQRRGHLDCHAGQREVEAARAALAAVIRHTDLRAARRGARRGGRRRVREASEAEKREQSCHGRARGQGASAGPACGRSNMVIWVQQKARAGAAPRAPLTAAPPGARRRCCSRRRSRGT